MTVFWRNTTLYTCAQKGVEYLLILGKKCAQFSHWTLPIPSHHIFSKGFTMQNSHFFNNKERLFLAKDSYLSYLPTVSTSPTMSITNDIRKKIILSISVEGVYV